MKSENKIILTIGVILTSGIAFFAYKKLKSKPKQSSSNSQQGNQGNDIISENESTVISTITSSILPTVIVANFDPKSLPILNYPVQKGDKGRQVYYIQKYLNNKGYSSPKLIEDGIFGPKTESTILKMFEQPYDVNIQKYLDYKIYQTDFSDKKIDKDFYDIFINKTKSINSLKNNTIFGF